MRNDGMRPDFACLKMVIRDTDSIWARSCAVRARSILAIRSTSDGWRAGWLVLNHVQKVICKCLTSAKGRKSGCSTPGKKLRNYPDTRNYTNTVDAENQRKPALDRAVACIQTFDNS